MTRAPILAALVFAACGGNAPPGFSTGPGVTGVPETTSASSTSPDSSSTSSAEDSASSASTSTGIIRDVGVETDFGTGQPPGCKGKVDLLFLIARSGNMKYVQDQFLASLPGFVQTIEDRLEDFDVHIMAANPDGHWPGYYCQSLPEFCATYDHCGPEDQNWDCDTSVQEWRPCDSELGAGNTFNAGAYAANRRCELYGGNRYIVSGEPDLAGNLACIAQAGITGGEPATGDALIAAVSPKLNAPMGCNAGFLRDDALLVVVIIHNTEDGKSQSWYNLQYDAVIAAKKEPGAVVMLAITAFPPPEGEPLDPDCIYEDGGDNDYLPLLEQFPYHLRENACADSYVPFFDAAVAMIDEACGIFVPQ